MNSSFRMVGEFHRKFGLPVTSDGGPAMVDDGTFLFRCQFLYEEILELMGAHRAGNLEGVADALVDLVYVALGTAHLYRIPFDEVFEEVHRANMQKERASGSDDSRSKRGSSLDVVKPEGWTPPDIEGVLRRPQKKSPGGPGNVSPSYGRLCSSCRVTPIHRSNTLGICPDCVSQKGLKGNSQ